MFLENVGQWIGHVELMIMNDAGEQERNHHVENGADGQRIKNSAWYVALRVFAFFRGGGNCIEPNERPEDRCGAFEHAGESIGHKWNPVLRFEVEKTNRNDSQN